jgi:hypothetical protein
MAWLLKRINVILWLFYLQLSIAILTHFGIGLMLLSFSLLRDWMKQKDWEVTDQVKYIFRAEIEHSCVEVYPKQKGVSYVYTEIT